MGGRNDRDGKRLGRVKMAMREPGQKDDGGRFERPAMCAEGLVGKPNVLRRDNERVALQSGP